MRDTSKALLKKLANGRPKPSKQALANLFQDIQDANIQALVSEVSSTTTRKRETPKASPLEMHAKKGLRKVSGKVKDFIPYLLEAAAKRDPESFEHLKAGKSLNAKITKIETLFASDAKFVVDEALTKFTTDHDTSYRLGGD